MPLNPQIPLMGANPQIPTYQDFQERRLTLQDIAQQQQVRQQQMQLQQMQMQEIQRKQAEQRKLTDSLRASGGDYQKWRETLLTMNPDAETVMGLDDYLTKAQTTLKNARTADLELFAKEAEVKGQLARSATDGPSFFEAIKHARKLDLITEEEAKQLLYQGYNPELMDTWDKQSLTEAGLIAREKARREEARAQNEFLLKMAAEERAQNKEQREEKLFPFQQQKAEAEAANAARGGAYSPERFAQEKTLIGLRNQATSGATGPVEVQEGNPQATEILGQTGMSLATFAVLTGQTSKLIGRSTAERAQARKEAEAFVRARGTDLSTMASQYEAINDIVKSNEKRLNATQIMEAELQATIQNLQPVIRDADLSRINFANVAKIWAGQQVNDPTAQQYAFHLQQLRNELAAYFAAAQGRSGNNIYDSDKQDADIVIRNGMSTGSLNGMAAAVKNSTDKMKVVMGASIDRANRAVWDLFGVGKNYKDKYTPTKPQPVRMIAPDGSLWNIDPEKVEAAKQRGFKMAQ